MDAPILGESRMRHSPDPNHVGLTCLEQILREAAHLFKKGYRQAQPPIQEVAPHPLDQAAENLFHNGSFPGLSHLEEQASPTVEVAGEPQER